MDSSIGFLPKSHLWWIFDPKSTRIYIKFSQSYLQAIFKPILRSWFTSCTNSGLSFIICRIFRTSLFSNIQKNQRDRGYLYGFCFRSVNSVSCWIINIFLDYFYEVLSDLFYEFIDFQLSFIACIIWYFFSFIWSIFFVKSLWIISTKNSPIQPKFSRP